MSCSDAVEQRDGEYRVASTLQVECLDAGGVE